VHPLGSRQGESSINQLLLTETEILRRPLKSQPITLCLPKILVRGDVEKGSVLTEGVMLEGVEFACHDLSPVQGTMHAIRKKSRNTRQISRSSGSAGGLRSHLAGLKRSGRME